MRALRNIIKVLVLLVSSVIVYSQSNTLPVFVIQPQGQNINQGQTLTLFGVANQAQTYQWYKNFVVLSNAVGAMYQQTNAQPADTGLYMLRAANTNGAVFSGAALITMTNAVTNTTIMVQLAWDANTEADIGGYKIYYWRDGTTNQIANVDVGNTNTAGIKVSFPTNLFRFYATAYNTGGLESAPSTQVSYQTPPYQPQSVNGVNAVLR